MVGARRRCLEALAHDPEFRVAENNIALTYAAEGDWASAAEWFARDTRPGYRMFNLGLAYMAQREYWLAAVAFEAAHKDAPGLQVAAARSAHARRLAEAAALGSGDTSRNRK